MTSQFTQFYFFNAHSHPNGFYWMLMDQPSQPNNLDFTVWPPKLTCFKSFYKEKTEIYEPRCHGKNILRQKAQNAVRNKMKSFVSKTFIFRPSEVGKYWFNKWSPRSIIVCNKVVISINVFKESIETIAKILSILCRRTNRVAAIVFHYVLNKSSSIPIKLIKITLRKLKKC